MPRNPVEPRAKTLRLAAKKIREDKGQHVTSVNNDGVAHFLEEWADREDPKGE
jgi:hypothetical protein